MRLGNKNYHEPWGHRAICDVCGFVFRGHELRLRWDNLRVCEADYEERHPQDLIKGRVDRQTPPFVRDVVYTFAEETRTDGSEL